MQSPLQTFVTAALLALCAASMETVVGVAGRKVTLPCRYDSATLSGTEVCWGRGRAPSLFSCENTLLYTDGEKVIYRRSYRYRLPGGLDDSQGGDVSLTLYFPREEDAGFYHCRVERPGLFNDLMHTVHLIIRPAPVVTFAPTHPPPVTDTPERYLALEYSGEDETETASALTDAPASHPEPLTDTPGTTLTLGLTVTVNAADEGGPDVIEDTTGPITGQVKRTEQDRGFPPLGRLESYLGNTVRMGAIVFLPGLILALLLRLRRSRNSRDRREDCLESP